MASNFLKDSDDFDIVISGSREVDGIRLYLINMRIGFVKWFVEHRYSDFSQLHKVLTSQHSVSKDILPPKLFFNSKSQQSIEIRRNGLESYLIQVVSFLSNRMPDELVMFLEMDKYDVCFIFRSLSNLIMQKQWIDMPPKQLNFSLLQVHAICEKLKLACPKTTVMDSLQCISSVLELCASLKEITISGDNKDFMGTSNIFYRKIPFELSSFKSLRGVTFLNVFMGNFVRADEMRKQLKRLKANYCKIKSINELLLCDNIHKDCEEVALTESWPCLKVVDLNHNHISNLDCGLELMSNVADLNLSFNEVRSINGLTKLQHLKVINLSHNGITKIQWSSIQIHAMKYLDLSNNKIVEIPGILQFPNLETLNLSFNSIDDFNELNYISKLEAIVNIDLIGNPISQKTDYRIKVLGKFGKRSSILCLDNEQATSDELEMTALVQALKFVQEGRSLTYNKNLSFDI